MLPVKLTRFLFFPFGVLSRFSRYLSQTLTKKEVLFRAIQVSSDFFPVAFVNLCLEIFKGYVTNVGRVALMLE